MNYLLNHLDTAWALTLIHLRLSLIPVIIGLLIAVPLGALVWRHRVFRRLTTFTASLVFTIPSLALFVALPNAGWLLVWPLTFVWKRLKRTPSFPSKSERLNPCSFVSPSGEANGLL